MLELPKEMLCNIFIYIPQELVISIPYINKFLSKLSNDNDIWNKISSIYSVKNLKLAYQYDKNDAKYSYLMQNKEIINMFVSHSTCYNVIINKYNLNIWSNMVIDNRYMSYYILLNDTRAMLFLASKSSYLLDNKEQYEIQKTFIKHIDIMRKLQNKERPPQLNYLEQSYRNFVKLYEKVWNILLTVA